MIENADGGSRFARLCALPLRYPGYEEDIRTAERALVTDPESFSGHVFYHII
jgi:hypothetical protein